MNTAEFLKLNAQIDEAYEEYCRAGEAFGDINAEYHGEVSRYGDAWVGAGRQLSGLYQTALDAEKNLKELQSKLPPEQGCVLPPEQGCECECVPF